MTTCQFSASPLAGIFSYLLNKNVKKHLYIFFFQKNSCFEKEKQTKQNKKKQALKSLVFSLFKLVINFLILQADFSEFSV